MQQTITNSLRNDQRPNCEHEYTYELSRERVDYINDRLAKIMPEEKPFLKYRYAIRNLADDIQVPAYQLSAYLNQKAGIKFNDFLNKFRVNYCEHLIQTGIMEQLNLKGLALHCGFKNRNTFASAFKKFTGSTPSHYLQLLNRNDRAA